MSDSGTKTGRAPVIQLDAEAKLRLVYLLLMHQNLPSINYDGFDPGTGHSTRAIQGLMDRLKKQFVTSVKPSEGVSSLAPPANGENNADAASIPKKRGRPAKKVAVNEEKGTAESPAKKPRGRPRKVVKEPEVEEVEGENKGMDSTKQIDNTRASRSSSKTPAPTVKGA